MASNQTKSIKPDVLKADQATQDALEDMAGYKPSNSDYTVAKIKSLGDSVSSAQKAYTQKETAFKAARDRLVAAQWAFHNAILGAKDQVVAQYGKDSDQAQAVGLKKKSERKKPVRKK
jgi:hypothetical protein